MRNVLCLLGPTASGKTDLVMEIVKDYPVEIVSVDSAMFYRQLSIGANKPTSAELLACPHHLIEVSDVTERYDVNTFIHDAHECIKGIIDRGNTPLLVGGTMMYFYQLINGLAIIPAIDPLQRESIDQRLAHYTLEELYNLLKICDPVWAGRIQPTDKQRIERGISVYWASGKSLSSYFDNQEKLSYRFECAGLDFPDRELHRVIIQKRLDSMIERGLEEEVKELWEKFPDLSLTFWTFVGYRQLREAIIGESTFELAKERIYFATCQLAKRQRTWMKKFNLERCSVAINQGNVVCPSLKEWIHQKIIS